MFGSIQIGSIDPGSGTLTIRNWDGWIDANETWTYASADAPTYTFTINADVTTKYSVGMRLKLTDVTVKYFIITAVSSYTGGNTTITIYGGTDYTLSGGAITLPYYSPMKAPFGFPLSPSKWTIELLSTANVSLISASWANIGSLSLTVAIGEWNVLLRGVANGNYDMWNYYTLSTANNSESDADFTTSFYGQNPNSFYITKTILLTSKTILYVNIKNDGTHSTYLRGDTAKTIIRAICAYL